MISSRTLISVSPRPLANPSDSLNPLSPPGPLSPVALICCLELPLDSRFASLAKSLQFLSLFRRQLGFESLKGLIKKIVRLKNKLTTEGSHLLNSSRNLRTEAILLFSRETDPGRQVPHHIVFPTMLVICRHQTCYFEVSEDDRQR
jgi:hypothetical protein